MQYGVTARPRTTEIGQKGVTTPALAPVHAQTRTQVSRLLMTSVSHLANLGTRRAVRGPAAVAISGEVRFGMTQVRGWWSFPGSLCS